MERSMKQKNKMSLFTIVILLFGGCAIKQHPINISTLSSSVNFHQFAEKLPMTIGLLLSKDFINNMPEAEISIFKKRDLSLWPWFFTQGVRPVFEDVKVIEDMKEIESSPELEVIIKPELWAWFYQDLERASAYDIESYCLLEIKYRFLDRNGNEITYIFSSGKAKSNYKLNSIAAAMDDVVIEFQKQVLSTKRQTILSHKKRS